MTVSTFMADLLPQMSGLSAVPRSLWICQWSGPIPQRLAAIPKTVGESFQAGSGLASALGSPGSAECRLPISLSGLPGAGASAAGRWRRQPPAGGGWDGPAGR
jgi:hypothetical protein